MTTECNLTVLGTIDLTPTWEGVLPALLAVVERSRTASAQREAYAELTRMAKLADGFKQLRADLEAANATADKLRFQLMHNQIVPNA